jgi:MvaI/BcnI restriction endonuclease family protein
MRRVLVALIIYRNRYLISKIPDGEYADQWKFPGGPDSADTTDFEAFRNDIKQTQASVKLDEGKEYYKYQKVFMLERFKFDGLLKALETAHMLIDFDARTGHNQEQNFGCDKIISRLSMRELR